MVIEQRTHSPYHAVESEHPAPTSSSPEFFYSERLKSYISFEPLKVTDRVVRAASSIDIDLDWDDEGRVNNISYVNAKKLMEALGSSLLSPQEYWTVHTEAGDLYDSERTTSLESASGTEWLDAVFQRDSSGIISMIEHPGIEDVDGNVQFMGQPVIIDQKDARPGWFYPHNNIDPQTGMPIDVTLVRERGSQMRRDTIWKYWSTFKVDEPVAGIRGYVTSSGTPSFDLDIPTYATQAALFLRECRKAPLEPELSEDLLRSAAEMIDAYQRTTVTTPGERNSKEHEAFYQQRSHVFDFIKTHGPEVVTAESKEAFEVREKMVDMLGILRLEAIVRGDQSTRDEIRQITDSLFPKIEDPGSFSSLTTYLQGTRRALEDALDKKKSIVFVMGHKNPDTDTVVSGLFEAYRNSLLDTDSVYIPVVQASVMPDEIAYLLGDELDGAYVLTDEQVYEQAKVSGQARWILVDHNKSEQQRFANSIIDHHILSATAQRQNVTKTWEMVGSSTAQITQKLYGIGVTPDQEMARILHGATLMDTENRGPKKMTYRDSLIMDTLQEVSQITGEDSFYQELMSNLLNTDDAKRLFERDYKQDWGIWGFAVAKVKNVFDTQGRELKPELLEGLIEQAKKNNEAQNFAMTMVKVVDYTQDNQTVNRERLYLLFNKTALPQFRQAMFEVLERIIEYEFKGKAQIQTTEDAIDFWGVGDQLSRKVTAPILEPLIAVFNEYYFSPDIGKYVKREFLKADDEVREAARALNIDLTQDKEGRVTNITFHEAKRLLDELGMSMLSLPEFWKVLQEANEMKDEQMRRHLLSTGFVEFLDTVVLNKSVVINHPSISDENDETVYGGEQHEVEVPDAFPALIYPEDIDPGTGIPFQVHTDPQKYQDPRVWRYWSPDADVVTPTRGHIFLLNRPALDMKVHPDDALPNLGIRPCVSRVFLPTVQIIEEESGLAIQIHT